jgi:predicted aldo/keto reductase-like oxidoreductase
MKTQRPALKRKGESEENFTFKDKEGHDAALAYVLENPHVGCAIPGVTTFDQVDSIASLGKQQRLAFFDRRTLHKLTAAAAGEGCMLCGSCSGECEKGVPARDILRAAMYQQNYGDAALAREAFSELEGARFAKLCGECDVCTFQCANKVAVKDSILDTARVLG